MPRAAFLGAGQLGAQVYSKVISERCGDEDGMSEIPLEEWGETRGAVRQLTAMRGDPFRR